LLAGSTPPCEPSRHRSRARLADPPDLCIPAGFLSACQARLRAALLTASPETWRRLHEAFTAA
jgi:hypothetical protein